METETQKNAGKFHSHYIQIGSKLNRQQQKDLRNSLHTPLISFQIGSEQPLKWDK